MRSSLSAHGFLALLVVLAACSSRPNLQNVPLQAGREDTFKADASRTLAACREAMVEAGMRIASAVQVDPDTWMLTSGESKSSWTVGEVVRVVVVQTSESTTTVHVYSSIDDEEDDSARPSQANSLLSQIAMKLRSVT